jgi:Zn-dependent M16 (insulinase) family peptidase
VAPRPDAPGASATYYEQPTSGIFYLSAVLGAGDLPAELVSLVPFFCYALTRSGTRRLDYLQVARHIDRYTGGLSASVSARTAYGDNDRCMPMVSVAGKCLVPNLGPMMDLVGELVGPGRFSELERLRKLVLEYRTRLESTVVHSGHRLAMSLAGRTLSPARQLGEAWSGVHQVLTMKKMADELTETGLAALADRLREVGRAVFDRDNCRLAAIGEEHALVQAEGHLAALRQVLASGGRDRFVHQTPSEEPSSRLKEGWSTSSAVAFVAQVQATVRMDHDDAAALAVIAKLMRSLYLHREIREKGGAYGGFALYSPEDGTFSCASYRDPHICATLDAFEGARKFLRDGDFGSGDIKEAILQVCSEIDKPDPPGPAARKAYYRRLIGLSREQRLAFKHRLLTVDRKMIEQATLNWFAPGSGRGSVAVIAGEEALKRANEKLADPLSLFAI